MIRFYFHPTPAPLRPARAIGNDHVFKNVKDEAALRALYPSNYSAPAR